MQVVQEGVGNVNSTKFHINLMLRHFLYKFIFSIFQRNAFDGQNYIRLRGRRRFQAGNR